MSDARSGAKRDRPQVLLFDFGGTLDADGVAWKDRFRWILGRTPSEQFDRAFYAADDALAGNIPKSLSFQETVERLSGNLARELGLDAEQGRRTADVFYRTSLEKAEASRQILGRLATSFRLGIVSNFYGNLAQICDDTGIGRHVGVVVDSAVVGFEKPDPRIFKAALSALDARPEDAVFVGDSLPRDMEGARNLGISHVYVAPEGASACCADDRVITSVSQLLEIYS
jgi:putative hydrolase of the HAD superfamily